MSAMCRAAGDMGPCGSSHVQVGRLCSALFLLCRSGGKGSGGSSANCPGSSKALAKRLVQTPCMSHLAQDCEMIPEAMHNMATDFC